MFNPRTNALSSRRQFFKRGATAGGLAAVASVGAPAYHALALDSPSDSRVKKILDRGKVIVGTNVENPPWHFEDASGKLVGMDIEMAKILAGGLFGLTQAQILGDAEPRKHIEFVVHAADSRIPDLLSDKVDINFQFMTVTAVRAVQVDFSIPYYREGVTLLLTKDSPYNSTADMAGKGLNIAILQNPTAVEEVHRGVPDANVQQLDSVVNSIQALDSGRVDATAVDLSTGRWLVSQSPDKYKTTAEGWDAQTYAASVKPGDQIWLNVVNSILHEALVGIDFPLYQPAFKTYFGIDLPNPPTGFPVEYK